MSKVLRIVQIVQIVHSRITHNDFVQSVHSGVLLTVHSEWSSELGWLYKHLRINHWSLRSFELDMFKFSAL